MKSVNDIDFTDIKVHEVLAKAERTRIVTLESQRLRILERAANPKANNGLQTPWRKLEDKLFIREGELSILGAYNGDGKTTLSTMLALHLAQDVPVGIASLEMELEDLGEMMGQQAAGSDNPPIRWHNDFLTWASDRIHVYDRLDQISPESALACVYHMAANLGCKFIVLDSLMMVAGVTDETDREKRFVTTLAAIAKKYRTHIMLVHHMRKPQSNNGKAPPMPTKFDLIGSSMISNLAMTVLIFWKDRDQAEAKLFDDHDPGKPDYKLCVAKQRFGRFEGTIAMWDAPGRRFSGTQRNELKPIAIPRLAA